MLSVLPTLVIELDRRGALDAADFVQIVQETAVTHRQAGDPHNLADVIHAISMQLHDSIPGTPSDLDSRSTWEDRCGRWRGRAARRRRPLGFQRAALTPAR